MCYNIQQIKLTVLNLPGFQILDDCHIS